jgi:hypothetical protein
MDPTEITKHIPEVVSVAKVAAASIPFTGIVKRMLGPAADEVAEMWRDQIRLYRYGRQFKCVEKAEKMAQDAASGTAEDSVSVVGGRFNGARRWSA